MRKFAFAIGAAALMLLAGVLTAEAMTGGASLGLRSAAKNFSPIDAVACRVAGPVCGLGRLGSAVLCAAAGAPAAGANAEAMALRHCK